MYETLMTAPTLVVTWALVKSGALTSWMSAWTASLTGHLYTNTIVMMIFFCFTTCKRGNWEGKSYYWCHSEHDNFFHSKLCFFASSTPKFSVSIQDCFLEDMRVYCILACKDTHHFQITKYISKKSPKTVTTKTIYSFIFLISLMISSIFIQHVPVCLYISTHPFGRNGSSPAPLPFRPWRIQLSSIDKVLPIFRFRQYIHVNHWNPERRPYPRWKPKHFSIDKG